MSSEQLLSQIEALPEESRRLLMELVAQLARQAEKPVTPAPPHPFKFDWEDGLAGAFPGASSVELQHLSSEWR
ncbi:MAG TPA: hypothetical protein PKX23_06435 [Verrucomicrobiota bacterium]|jgi:hypothetical protein|nr:hypothetical protein [Verrucomicrobiota bacterium]HRT56399.1 hypothetical protein [Candidatus Paceibacterota bacterium]